MDGKGEVVFELRAALEILATMRESVDVPDDLKEMVRAEEAPVSTKFVTAFELLLVHVDAARARLARALAALEGGDK